MKLKNTGWHFKNLYNGKEENVRYPRTEVYKDLDDCIDRCMIPDYNEFE